MKIISVFFTMTKSEGGHNYSLHLFIILSQNVSTMYFNKLKQKYIRILYPAVMSACSYEYFSIVNGSSNQPIAHLHYVVLFSFHLWVSLVHPFSCRQCENQLCFYTSTFHFWLCDNPEPNRTEHVSSFYPVLIIIFALLDRGHSHTNEAADAVQTSSVT